MSFDENNIIFKQYFIPDKYDKSLIFSKTLQDYIAGIKGLSKKFLFLLFTSWQMRLWQIRRGICVRGNSSFHGNVG